MVEKAGLEKHRRSREAKGFDDAGKVVDGAVHVEVAMEDVQGGRGSGR